MIFDKSDSESTFLSLVGQQSIALTDSREQALADAWAAAKEAKQQSVKTLEPIAELNNIDALTDDQIPERCAIKFANGWLAKGVMIIQREPNNRYFDHRTLRSYGLKQLKQKLQHFYQSNFTELPQKWRIESLAEAPLPAAVAPLSYKFYFFNGVAGLITQTDYNNDAPELALFDGSFAPLKQDKDYRVTGRDLVSGHHIIPQRAADFLKAAQDLALMSKSPFVAVKLYAATTGPVFAGFDFAPRLIHKRMVTLSHAVIDDLDEKLQGARKRIEASSTDYVFGQSVDEAVRLSVMLASVDSDALTTLEELPEWKYQRLASVARVGGAKGAWRLSDKYKQLQEQAPNKLAALLNERWKNCWDAIKQLNSAV